MNTPPNVSFSLLCGVASLLSTGGATGRRAAAVPSGAECTITGASEITHGLSFVAGNVPWWPAPYSQEKEPPGHAGQDHAGKATDPAAGLQQGSVSRSYLFRDQSFHTKIIPLIFHRSDYPGTSKINSKNTRSSTTSSKFNRNLPKTGCNK
jgi:hypothetical protein